MGGNLDEGLEWCENRLLKFQHLCEKGDIHSLLLAPQSNNPSVLPPDPPTLARVDVEAALSMAFKEDGLEILCKYLRPVIAKRHQIVFEEGAVANGLYIV